MPILESVSNKGQQDALLLPLEAIDIKLQIGEHKLIDGINLSLSTAEFSVVMGSNGAGKTLFLQLLHGLLKPSSGKILWGGKPISKAIRKRQAMVFQKPVLLRRSVAANIDFVLRLTGKPDPDNRDELLDQVGLLGQAKQPARRLSGGEQQRLALARALAIKPQVLFLDEPTASLDPASVYQIEDAVKMAHKSGIKLIFVTHDIGQARRLADEVIFLHRGRLAEQSRSETFFSNPNSVAAEAYLEGRIML